MKSLKYSGQNPQKQGKINILSYFDSPKLYKRQNNNISLHSSRQKIKKKSPISGQSYFTNKQQRNMKAPQTARNSYRTQNNKVCQQSQYYSGYYTARNHSKQKNNDTDLQNKLVGNKVRVLKKQINSGQKNRFYYKKQYDSNDEEQQRHHEQSFKSQYQTILPSYFSKTNNKSSKIQQIKSQRGSHQRKQKRSLSPLEESQQQLFAKCYKQTSNHLNLMLKEIYQSQDKLDFIHHQILQGVYATVKKKSQNLRGQLIEIVQKILDEWEDKEWQFIKTNQILFIDDLFELKEQLNERQNKVKVLIQRLDKQKTLSWIQDKSQLSISQTVSKRQTVWKNVTTDLLMFNYENSIMEIQQLSEKIMSLIPQKCQKAIEIINSAKYKQKTQLKSQAQKQTNLKDVINKIMFQLSQNYFQNQPYENYVNVSSKYYQTNEFSTKTDINSSHH